MMRHKLWLFCLSLTVTAFGYFGGATHSAHAACTGYDLNCGTDPGTGKVVTPLADPTSAFGLLGGTISTVITVVIFAAAITTLVMFALGAIQWGTAQGGDGAAKGRTTMKYAIGGLILIALVYVGMLLFQKILPQKASPDTGAPVRTCNIAQTCSY